MDNEIYVIWVNREGNISSEYYENILLTPIEYRAIVIAEYNQKVIANIKLVFDKYKEVK